MLWTDGSMINHRRISPRVYLALVICALSIIDTINAASMDNANTWTEFSTSCAAEDAKNVSVSCHGVRIVRKIVQQLLDTTNKERNIELFEGVSLVDVPGSSRKARVLKGFGSLGPFLQFLEGRELRVKLPSLLPPNIESALKESLPSEAEARKEGGGLGGFGGGGGGGGKKGGGGGLLLMALMMGKMMAAMGFGALGLLAMKALMVSAMALMLSLIIAVKKLAHGGDDHGSGHHVVYAQEVGHHHRKKRSIDDDDDSTLLPYRGYANLYANLRAS